MLAERVIRGLDALSVLPETRAALVTLVKNDLTSNDEEQVRQLAVLSELYKLLGGKDNDWIDRFGGAWTTLKVALARLDHLQDNDPEDHPLPTVAHVGAQYNLVFAYYLLADSLLNDLTQSTAPAPRLLHLHRLWTECMLRAASGQQQDLTAAALAQANGLNALDHYQQVAQAKSGAVFELAFGGAAILATDDATAIHACRAIGELFGTLVQFRDDLADAVTQTTPALTLPQSYAAAMTTYTSQLPPHTMHPYWQFIYNAYHEQAKQVLVSLPLNAQTRVLEYFSETFE